jgi:internalin A
MRCWDRALCVVVPLLCSCHQAGTLPGVGDAAMIGAAADMADTADTVTFFEVGPCTFRDPDLARAVASKASSAGIPEDELVSLTVDYLADLSGIGCLSKLERLTIYDGTVSDLSPLAGHPSLRYLWIFGNVDDLSPLASVEGLTDLVINSPSLRSLAGLAPALRLQTLDVEGPLDSFEGIQGAPALTRITALGHGPRSVSGLRNLPMLRFLDLGVSSIASLAGLEDTPALEQLHLDYADLTSCQGLGQQPSLLGITAHGSQLASLEGIEAAPNLRALDVHDTQIGSLERLAGLRQLRSLNASGTSVADLTPLTGLPLEDLRLADAPVSDLGPLRPSSSLKRLDVSGTLVADLSPLNASPLLEEILAQRTPMTTLDGLDALPALRALQADESKLTSLGNIERLQPIYLGIVDDPLDSEALQIVVRLCTAGWAVAWSAGTARQACGSPCELASLFCPQPP